MSDRKNYNSIVFLTTLSLYLGLVLAGGATPSVLAQAATTRNFDIKSEIVVEDDLDKKPDDELLAELKNNPEKPDKQFIEQHAETILALLEADRPAEDDELFGGSLPTLRNDVLLGGIEYTLDKDKLLSKLNLKSKFETDIASVGRSCFSGLDSRRLKTPDRTENAISENSQTTFENNQVFIVTRLPRASIDDSLADKNAR
jgi:hypothetical protein